MKSVTEFFGMEIVLIKSKSARRTYELKSGEELLGILKFPSAFSSLAIASCKEGSWTFKRKGFFASRIEIRESGKEEILGEFKYSFWKNSGTLEFNGGLKFITTFGWMKSNLEINNETGQNLLKFNSKGFFRTRTYANIDYFAKNLKELPLLILLGNYLILMARQDAAATSSTAAAY